MSDRTRGRKKEKTPASDRSGTSGESARSVKQLIEEFDSRLSSTNTSPDRENQEEKINKMPKAKAGTSRDADQPEEVRESVSAESAAAADLFDNALAKIEQEAITAANINNLLKTFLHDNSANLLSWIEHNIAFSGFDALAMRRKLLTIGTLDKIILCLLVGLVRGNNITRISGSMRSPEVKKRFENAVKAFKVKVSVKGDYTAVTLSRMIACFPETVARILHAVPIPMALDYSDLTSVHQEYPKASRHQVCACIIPDVLSNDELSMALNVIMLPYLRTSEIINTKNIDWKKLKVSEKFNNSEQYLMNSYNSKVVSAEDRLVIATEIGMVVGETLASSWKASAVEAVKYLNEVYI